MRKTVGWYVVLLMAFVGCSDTGVGMLPVDGTVAFTDGKPVVGEMATIVFHPEGSASEGPTKSASGQIDAEGKFQLMTKKPNDGAYPGDYKVVLQVWSNYRQQKSAVPQLYTNQQTTPLTATVSPDKTSFDFSIDR